MSLKFFHIVFITLSILMALLLGVFSFRHSITNNNSTAVLFGISCFALAVALIVYGFWFLKELKKLK